MPLKVKFLVGLLCLCSGCGFIDENENPPVLKERLAAKQSRTGGLVLSSGIFELTEFVCSEGKVKAESESSLKTGTHKLELRSKQWAEIMTETATNCVVRIESAVSDSIAGKIFLKGDKTICSTECKPQQCRASDNPKSQFAYGYVFDGVKLKIQMSSQDFCETKTATGSWLLKRKTQ